MAGIDKTKAASGTIYYVRLSAGEDARRPKITLGRCSMKDARTARDNIETILRAKRTGAEISEGTSKWIADMPSGLRKRLEALGLIEPPKNKATGWTVGAFIADYIQRRTDVKEPTKRKWKDVERKLNAFFRDDNIEDVTIEQAKNFRVYLKTTVGLSDNSIRRHTGICRQFFDSAVNAEIIRKNPFKDKTIPVTVRPNKARFFYVTPPMAQKVLDTCPDAQWRLIFGLARFGGLRCPSEVLRLKWEDVEFEHEQFTVHASKTEHHTDGGIRIVPMFPELKPLFQEAFEEARNEKEQIRPLPCISRYRDVGVNLRTQLGKIIIRAGLKPWPKLFQNCRSTRETELFKITGGNVKAVCEWIGNSPEVAMTHYAQVTDADRKEAAKISVINDGKNLGLNPGLHRPIWGARGCTEDVADSDVSPYIFGTKASFAPDCTNVQKRNFGPLGTRTNAVSS